MSDGAVPQNPREGSIVSYRHVEADDSVCCSKQPVQYWWLDAPPVANDDAIEAIVDRVEALLSSWDWNDYTLNEELGQLEALLERALDGALQPIDEIKSLQRSLPWRIFELRQAVAVEKWDRIGSRVVNRRQSEQHVRIYHGEDPPTVPAHAIGVHVHLKSIVDGDEAETNRLQNVEIDRAVKTFSDGQPDMWGLPH